MAAPGWASLRQSLRALESQTEQQFAILSQYISSPSLPAEPSELEREVSTQITTLLTQREASVSQLSRLLDSESALSTSALKQNNLTRHRELLTDHRSELRRIQNQISENRNRQHLLTNIRNDIDAHHADSRALEDQESEAMLRERNHLDSSHNVLDGIISQAYAISGDMGLQRETLASVNRRITMAAGQLPGVNALMNRIGSKRRRDGVILGAFIAVCFLLFWFLG